MTRLLSFMVMKENLCCQLHIEKEDVYKRQMIMCVAAYEMKRLGLAHKPLIIGLQANVHEIADTSVSYTHLTGSFNRYPGIRRYG